MRLNRIGFFLPKRKRRPFLAALVIVRHFNLFRTLFTEVAHR